MESDPLCEAVASADAYRMLTSAYADGRVHEQLVRLVSDRSLVKLADTCRVLSRLVEAEILRRNARVPKRRSSPPHSVP